MNPKEYYNRLFKEGLNTVWNDAPGKKVLLSAFVDLVESRENAIVDVGCGDGYFINEIRKCNPVADYEQCYSAFDISEEAVLSAQKKYGGIAFSAMDAVSIKYGDNSFDVVLSYGVIEHILDPLKALIEIKRILKPGGLFLTMVPSLDSYRNDRFDEGWYEDLDSNKQLQWNFRRKTWEAMFLEAGLRLFSCDDSKKYGALKPGVFFFGLGEEFEIRIH